MTLRNLTVHHIGLAKTSLFLSGGEKAEIEIVDYLNRHEREVRNIIYTSESGKILYGRLKKFKDENFTVIGKIFLEKRFGEIVAYYLRIPELFFHLKKFEPGSQSVIFSHDEFLPTILYSFLLKCINPSAKWIFIYHMKAPSIFRGYEGEFTGEFHFPTIRLLRYILEQKIAFFLTKKVNIVLTVNEYYRAYLGKIYGSERIHVIEKFGGPSIPKLAESMEKKYDIIWMGRFHAQKGLTELIDVAGRLRRLRPDIKIAVLGGGNGALEKDFIARIKEKGLERCIEYFGFITGDEKYRILQQGKIFLMTSLFESFGIVNLEAMGCGLPVVAYDLPVFNVFDRGMVKVPVRDNAKMAEEVGKLLDDQAYYERIKYEAELFSASFFWEITGQECKLILDKI